jgi:hypothetical protein
LFFTQYAAFFVPGGHTQACLPETQTQPGGSSASLLPPPPSLVSPVSLVPDGHPHSRVSPLPGGHTHFPAMVGPVLQTQPGGSSASLLPPPPSLVSPVSVVPGGHSQYAELFVPGGHTQYAELFVPGGHTQYAELFVPGGHMQYAELFVPGGQKVVCFLATEAAGAMAATIAAAINAASRYFLIVTGLS